jgi:hypothetical protein
VPFLTSCCLHAPQEVMQAHGTATMHSRALGVVLMHSSSSSSNGAAGVPGSHSSSGLGGRTMLSTCSTAPLLHDSCYCVAAAAAVTTAVQGGFAMRCCWHPFCTLAPASAAMNDAALCCSSCKLPTTILHKNAAQVVHYAARGGVTSALARCSSAAVPLTCGSQA